MNLGTSGQVQRYSKSLVSKGDTPVNIQAWVRSGFYEIVSAILFPGAGSTRRSLRDLLAYLISDRLAALALFRYFMMY